MHGIMGTSHNSSTGLALQLWLLRNIVQNTDDRSRKSGRHRDTDIIKRALSYSLKDDDFICWQYSLHCVRMISLTYSPVTQSYYVSQIFKLDSIVTAADGLSGR